LLPLYSSGKIPLAARRALYTVATCDGALEPREELFLSLHSGDDVPLSKISAEEVKEAISDPGERRALVQRLVLMSALDEEIRPEEITEVRRFALVLGVDEPGVAQLEMLAKKRTTMLGFDLMRRGFFAKQWKKEWQARGLRGLWSMARAAKGSSEIAARYRALQELPEESLGRAIHQYYQRNQFSMPGEEGGPPEVLLFHDLGHALTGYSTDPPGEVQMCGFEAGYMREDGFSAVLLGLLLFHYGETFPGIQATPAKGMFDIERFQEAYQRGLSLTQDLRDFDFWSHAKQPLAQVKEQLGLSSL
jgi:hypothetical protein